MTTLVLRTAGSVIGGAFLGPLGAAIGGALGASAGYAIDQSLFGAGPRSVEGPRLSDLEVQTSSEGAPITRVYGRARLNGQIIWATNHSERVTRREQRTGAAKGGGSGGRVKLQTTYSYYANFAVGLCEGEIASIGRIWANGTEIDLQDITYRLYRGTEDQPPDSLIEAKQGAGNAPAYRGLAYVVFEDLPLADFGNRIPQLSFEVIRPVGDLEKQIRSVVMIPGATEFGYDTVEISRKTGEGVWSTENRNSHEPGTDFEVSLDHLLAICPNLQRIALVVSWFGTDLRAEQCEIRPAVDERDKVTDGADWSVAGLVRAAALEVSGENTRPAYGGTPSDDSVKRAIAAIRSRGLEVVLYPFVMMDIPADNDLPDPYGGSKQAPFPWRGRITCYPGPEQENTADKSILVDQQIAHFFSDQTWNYRCFILHYAQLASEAGGVDAFLIGSELRGLTWLRNDQMDYPFVSALKSLASDVKGLVGETCKLSYGADWSEYFGHQPANENGYVRFHLDPLWNDPNIDAIGIDNYMPLSDWRSGDQHLDAQLSDNGLDETYLQSNIAGGEGYDWYYANEIDRSTQTRTPISDGASGKPWTFRFKDLVNWWQNPHYEREGGQERPQPTEWVPQSKPIWFTELGCPAVHLGPNEPNRFPDRKSAESGLPHHSAGARDDAAQRAMLQACLSYWKNQVDDSNPRSSIYGAPMVDPDQIFLWAWDARPFPIFPLSRDVWSDGESWEKGHWLNGRLGNAPIKSVIESVFDDFDLPSPQISATLPVIDGFVIDRPMSARNALQGLCDMFGLGMQCSGEQTVFNSIQKRTTLSISEQSLAENQDAPLLSKQSEAWESEIASVSVGFKEILQDYRQSVARFVQPAARTLKEANKSLAVISTQSVMSNVAKQWLRESNYIRHSISFALPPSSLALEVGDVIELQEYGVSHRYRIMEMEDGVLREVEASLIAPRNTAPTTNPSRRGRAFSTTIMRPIVEVLDLPLLPGKASMPHAPYLAAFAKPWQGPLSLYEGSSSSGFSYRQTLEVPAIIGELTSELSSSQPFIWDRGSVLEVKLYDGALASLSKSGILSGGNAAAIRAQNGTWEILQFANAELIGNQVWHLTDLVRGQLGSENAALVGAATGARFVLLDEAIVPLENSEGDIGKSLNCRLVSAGSAINDPHNLDLEVMVSGYGLKPLSPVHLRIRREGQDLLFSWIRRGRTEADSWVGSTIPLDEDFEQYQLTLKASDSDIQIRRDTVNTPEWRYRQEDQQIDGLSGFETVEIESNKSVV